SSSFLASGLLRFARNDGVRALRFDHEVVALDRHGERLGAIWSLDERFAGFDRHIELADTRASWVAVRLAGANLEPPAVPRASDEFAVAPKLIVADAVGLHQRNDPALAQLGGHVR